MTRTWFAPLFLACSLLLPGAALGQAGGTGRIIGRVLDAESGRALTGARVLVQGTTRGATAGVDGRYLVEGVPASAQSLIVSLVGYADKTVTGLQVPSGGSVNADVTLSAQALGLEAITVTATAERGSVNRALDEQRTATGVVNAITAEQIARSPDSDAGAAVQRVSGVTVQEGKFVFVRGLGERYTTTALNGARIPSPEPERKVVPLDLFPTGLLQTITTSKTFTPDQPGDFSGAHVDIRTREFPARRQTALSLSTGYNSVATGQTVFAAPREGREWLAFGGAARALPAPAEAAGDFRGRRFSQEEINRIAGSFRNRWSPVEETAAPNASASASVGGTDNFVGREVGYLFSGTYSKSQEAQVNQLRTRAIADAEGRATEGARFVGSTGRSSVLWGGLLNLSSRFGEDSRVSFNNTYNRTSDNDARSESGFDENFGSLPLFIERLRFVERSVRSNQLLAEHQLGDRHRIDWQLTSSGVTRREPDRSELVYAAETDYATGKTLAPAWYGGSNEAAVRTFGDLRENAWEGGANYRVDFGNASRSHLLKFGALARYTDRDAENRAYSIFTTSGLDAAARQGEPEQLFDRLTRPGSTALNVAPLGAGGSYTASDRLFAGYGMAEYAIRRNVRVVGGARVERSDVTVDAQPTYGRATRTSPSYTDVLPSLAVNVALSDRQNLRVSASRTLARPEYRELSPILYREVIGAENLFGDPSLRRTLIQNYDARYEWYPNAGEVLSVAAFAKRFTDPIERVYVAASGTALVTFVNASGAENYGVELEARKALGTVAPVLEPWTAFANATLMHSDIRIGGGIASRTNDQRPMVGQAPYVLNTGLTYASAEGGLTGTLLYNVVGRRIVAAAEAPLEDVYEQPRHVLDLGLRFGLGRGIAARFDARNLLDEPYQVTQGQITREYYRTGRVFSLGLAWRP